MKVSRFMARQYARPSGWFGRHVVGRLLNRANIKSNLLVLESLDLESDSEVLEIGFGGGDLLEMIVSNTERYPVHGLEISDVMIERMKSKIARSSIEHRIVLKNGSIDNLPYDDGQFNRVCSVNTIYFWKSLQLAVAELRRVLKPEGVLVLGTGSAQVLRELGYEDKGFQLHSIEQITSALGQNGFQSIQVNSFEQKERGAFNAIRALRIPGN